MKNALPENAKVAKEAKECMQECVSEFISFITSEGTYSFSAISRRLLISRAARLTIWYSFGEVPAGEKEDGQRRGYLVRHDFAGL